MAHTTNRSFYDSLVSRLNQVPQGAPVSESLYKILKILFSEKEAELVSLLPIRPFSAEKAAKIWKKGVSESKIILETLASKGMLLDNEFKGEQVFILPPTMAGFFEFSMMRIRNDYDQKALGELFHQYLNTEEDFTRELFTGSETNLGRVFVNEETIPRGDFIEVLDYEKSSEIIRTSPQIGLGVCYCRHKMQHLGKNCDAPMEICFTFNNSAQSLIKHGIAREIDKSEALDLLQAADEYNLVQFGDNVRNQVNFICNCCGCCCEAMLAAKRFAFTRTVQTSNYIASINEEGCTGCGKCVEVCPVESLSLVSAGNPRSKRKKKAQINEDICLGCGVCVRVCKEELLHMNKRKERVITPMNSAHRTVLMAIEKGMLQNLIADTQALYSHRVMALILGVILKLPPVKQIMASKQMKSRYLEYILTRMEI